MTETGGSGFGAGPLMTAPVSALYLEPWHGQSSSAAFTATVQPLWVQTALKGHDFSGRRLGDDDGLAVGVGRRYGATYRNLGQRDQGVAGRRGSGGDGGSGGGRGGGGGRRR